VLLFTNGLFEVRGSDEEYYDHHRLLSSALRCIDLRADDLCEQVVDDVQQFAATKDFADDVCLIAMEIDHLMKG
jgi:phosphoserine phosphatase RsbU/P